MAAKKKEQQKMTQPKAEQALKPKVRWEIMPCPDCHGRGFHEVQAGLIMKRCPRCKGKGKIRQRVKDAADAVIPPIGPVEVEKVIVTEDGSEGPKPVAEIVLPSEENIGDVVADDLAGEDTNTEAENDNNPG